MQSTTTPRFITFTSLALASGALALSAWTACNHVDSGDDSAGPAPHAQRSAAAPAPTAKPAPAENPVSPPAAEPAPAVRPDRAEPAAALEAPAAQDAAAPAEVKRLVLASSVEDREPIALSGSAPLGEPLVAFVELSNPGPAPLELVVTFEHSGGTKVGFVELEIPPQSPRFRTWARTRNIRRAGEWQAVVRQKDGPELARQGFTAAEAPGVPDPA